LSFLQKQSRQWLIYKIVKQAESQDLAILLEELAASCFDRSEFPVYLHALKNFMIDREADLPVLAEAVASWRKKNARRRLKKDNLSGGSSIDSEKNTGEISFVEEETTQSKVKDADPGESDLKEIATNKRIDEAVDQTENSKMEEASADKTGKGNETIQPEDILSIVMNDKVAAVDNDKTIEEISPDHQASETLRDDIEQEDHYVTTVPLLHYINNAGLVLVYPYLQPLFQSQGLLVKNQFKNRVSRDKAVQFLCYLAYGETGLPEYELVLPKLLCGLLPVDTVNRFLPLSEEEKSEADSLLKALLAHWNALKNTSAEGLRINFLQREGRLQWKNEEWRLRVTQLTHDILLDRLPWGISIIRLPWMKFFLKTEWV